MSAMSREGLPPGTAGGTPALRLRGFLMSNCSRRTCTLLIFFPAVLSLLPSTLAGQQPVKFDAATISGLPARNIGSAATSGRIAAVDAVAEDGRLNVFVGSASGGVWKSVNGGTSFKPVFDREPVQSIGAVAIDRSNPKIVWVGTGESWMRNSVSVGDGIYKSTDGGEKIGRASCRERV